MKGNRFEQYSVPGKWMLAGIVLAGIVVAAGFSKGYLVSGSEARELATEKAQNAIVAAEAPICAAQALKDPKVKERMGTLRKFDAGYDFDTLGKTLDEFGWSTMPGSKTATDGIAVDCFSKVRTALKDAAKDPTPQAMK